MTTSTAGKKEKEKIGKTGAEALRSRAKALLEQAEKIDEKKRIQIGLIVQKVHEANWQDFDLDDFKKQVRNIFS